MTVAESIARARDALLTAGVSPDEAPGDAEMLARHALGWDLTQFALHRNEPASPDFVRAFGELIARRSRREPVSQIVGHREFWGLDFFVTRDVLTPRPETELVVEAALTTLARDSDAIIVDVGTGSGCLAVALATEFPNARVIATDVSRPALAVARRNADRHGVSRRIAFVHTGLLEVETDVDLIVSNPPYIALRNADALPAEVRSFEPHVALFAGDDGLSVIRDLLRDNRTRLADGGRMIIEVGYDQAGAVARLAEDLGWSVERIHRDLQRIDRVLTLYPACEDHRHG